ncbi:hypothetical protein HPB47_028268 [Ixodes persulcatus]|uniref:Uncharacterized protein n=1 Tax=Ixodes persulcatus TaxID=34615 RepID=A0AC60PUY3_IXOPE|nr:hypothetical protein HPB47_028268 [Ixodes persulcatus]
MGIFPLADLDRCHRVPPHAGGRQAVDAADQCRRPMLRSSPASLARGRGNGGEDDLTSLSLAVASKNSEEPPPVSRGGAWCSASESFQCPRLVSCHEDPVECLSAV